MVIRQMAEKLVVKMFMKIFNKGFKGKGQRR